MNRMKKALLPPAGETPPLCACQCNGEVTWNVAKGRWNLYLHGHNSKTLEARQSNSDKAKAQWADPVNRQIFMDKKIAALEDPALRKQISESVKKLWEDPEYRENQARKAKEAAAKRPPRKKWQKKKATPEALEKLRAEQSARLKERWADPVYRAKASERARKHFRAMWQQEGFRERASERMTKRWADKEKRKEQSEKLKARCADPERKQHMSDAMKEVWKRPGYVEVQRQFHADPEYIENWRQGTLEKWQDNRFVQNVMDGKKTIPNRLELLFDSLTADSIVFVGNGQFWRTWANGRNKNPDFLVYNDQGEYEGFVIELWGTYWHRNDDPMIDLEMWSRLGCECLIIWEHELHEDQERILDLVSDFIGEEARSA